MASETNIMPRKISRRAARWAKTALLGILLVIALLVIVKAARGIAAWWTLGQARSYCVEASRLLDNGQTDQGIALLLKAWQMAPEEPGILREIAQRLDELPARASDAAVLWRKVANHPSATAEDSVKLAAALVKTANASAARHVLESLPADVRQRPGSLEIEADLLMIEGREQESEELLRFALEKSPDDPKARTRLAKMQLNSIFNEIRQEARRTLWELSRGGGKMASKAMLALSTQPLSGSEIMEARAIISSNSGIKSTDRLAILAACARQQPALADELVMEESQRIAGKRPEDCTEYFTWLADMGQADRILQGLSENGNTKTDGSREKGEPILTTVEPKAEVLKSRDLFLAFGDALIIKKDWNSFSTLLMRHSLPVGIEEAALMKAICANGMGDPLEEIDSHLAVALTYVRNKKDPFGLVRVADQAERLERFHLALQALINFPPSNQIMHQEVLRRSYRLQKAMGLTEDLLTTADAILETQPELVPYVDEASYLRLLTGREMERELHRFSPEHNNVYIEASPLSQLVWSLSAFQCGSLNAARQWLDGMNGSGLAVGHRAVFAGLLKLTGRAADAFRIAEKIPPGAILPEENWFLQQALN